MAAVVAEILTDRTSRIWSEELHRGRIRSRGVNDDRIVHCPELFELLTDLSNGRCLLPDRYINADDVLTFLVDDRVDSNGRLTCLAVADDQFTLAAPDRNH